MNKILLCDIDGTLTDTKSRHAFKQNSDDIVVIGGVNHALNHFLARDFRIIGISNQAGVEKGYKTLDATIQEMKNTIVLLPQISEIYFCPDFQGKICWRVTAETFNDVSVVYPSLCGSFRKPNTGMADLAINTFIDATGKDPEKVLMVGDLPSDAELAQNLACEFMWAYPWVLTYGK